MGDACCRRILWLSVLSDHLQTDWHIPNTNILQGLPKCSDDWLKCIFMASQWSRMRRTVSVGRKEARLSARETVFGTEGIPMSKRSKALILSVGDASAAGA
jgi:hypothetical protein